jgi:hypothetical protein
MTTPKRRRWINHRDNPPPTEIPGAPPVRAEKRWPQNESARQARGKAGAEGKDREDTAPTKARYRREG